MRRKPRVVWLPPDKFNRLGVAPPDSITVGNQQATGAFRLTIPPGAGSSHTENIPLVLDRQLGISQIGIGTLSDIESSGYRLRRIVGELFVQAPDVDLGAGAASHLLITIGIIVLRVSESTGDPLEAGLDGAYSPQLWENQADPWVWRRSWALSNFSQALAVANPDSLYPGTNAQVSSYNGPHVDAKTARVLGPEERLFMVCSGASLDGDVASQINSGVNIVWDLRFLASMRTSSGNRRNASR